MWIGPSSEKVAVLKKVAALNYYNHGQNILDKLLFSCKIGHHGKSAISIFQEFFAITEKESNFGGSTSLQSYEVLIFSEYSLIW